MPNTSAEMNESVNGPVGLWKNEWLDHPTRDSIAAARAAQQRERLTITEATGIRLNRNGRLLFPWLGRHAQNS